ncbi:hypothetical protein D3C72_2096250 [compost metagenome]
MLKLETAGTTVELFECIDGVDDVIAGAVELFLRVLQVFADLPHQQFDHHFALLAHAYQEGFDMLNPLGYAHGRPNALAVVISLDCGVQRDKCCIGVQQWGSTEDNLGLLDIAC